MTPREMGENPQDMTVHNLMQLARQAKCPNNDSVQRKHIEALIARVDVGSIKLEAYLMSPEARGRDVFAWGDHFKANGKPAPPPTKRDPIKRIHPDGSYDMV